MNKIHDFHNFWRFWSVRLALLSGGINATALAIIGAYAMLPADWLPIVSAEFKTTVAYSALGSAGVTALLAAFARGVQQTKLEPKP